MTWLTPGANRTVSLSSKSTNISFFVERDFLTLNVIGLLEALLEIVFLFMAFTVVSAQRIRSEKIQQNQNTLFITRLYVDYSELTLDTYTHIHSLTLKYFHTHTHTHTETRHTHTHTQTRREKETEVRTRRGHTPQLSFSRVPGPEVSSTKTASSCT